MVLLVRALFITAGLLAVPTFASAVPFTISGSSTGADAMASGTLTLLDDTITLTLDNTSPFDARITGLGFDLFAGDFTSNNSTGLNGYTGADVLEFEFSDGVLGNVPQFGNTVLDFGWLTGNSFNGGFPNDGLAPGDAPLVFSATGNFFALTETEIADALFVRFQRVGADGEGSDVGTPGDVPNVPEPASLLLFGLGLAGAAAVRRRL